MRYFHLQLLTLPLLFLFVLVSCKEKELDAPTPSDLSGTIWETSFTLTTPDTYYGAQVFVELELYFSSKEDLRMVWRSTAARSNPLDLNIKGSYSLNKNILTYYLEYPANYSGIEFEWIITKRTKTKMILKPRRQGTNYSRIINHQLDPLLDAITLTKKS